MMDNDFGFTFEDSEELKTKIKTESSVDKKAISKYYTDSMTSIIQMFMPLLNNLTKDPEKDTIRWPNREKVIKEFITSVYKQEEDLRRGFDERFGK